MAKKITIALAGNPNSGKTTIFNRLTGSRQHVGNYPGVTVEKKEGTCTYKDYEINVVDLPGTYSLTAYSIEEIVARNFIIEEKPDVVVDILDASNLERNLYLSTQFMELGAPLVLVLNMSDVAKARGIEFDINKLSNLLGAPIVLTVGNKGEGIEELLEAVVSVVSGKFEKHRPEIKYGAELEKNISAIEQIVKEKKKDECEKYGARWAAIKLLENDKEVRRIFNSPDVLAIVDKRAARLEKLFGDPPEIILADRRYGFISGACQQAVKSTVQSRYTISDRIDTIVTNRVLGIPIFLGLMYMVFQLTFTLGDPPMGWIENFFGWLGDFVSSFWTAGSESALKSLLVDGIIAGVGGVVVFLPNILLLFLAIAILEDSGYMARAAFIMDRIMHKIGLHGKSFIPLLLGFGCTIPAVMATRTIENERDRLTTILVSPLMSCGARLPIYALIIPAFFTTKQQGPMLWTIYIIGIVLAIVLAKLIRTTVFKGEAAAFVMELPPYHMPTLKGVLIHMWERGALFLKKAGTIILGVSIVLWVITSYPKPETFPDKIKSQETTIEEVYKESVLRIAQELGVSQPEKLMEALKKGEMPPDILSGKGQQFVEIVSGIRKAESEFSQRTEEIEEGSLAYVQALNYKKKSIDALKKKAPEVFGLALQYVEKTEAAYHEALRELQNERAFYELDYSIAGRIGNFLGPIMRPLGFNKKLATPMIGAIAAKEVFVAQLGIVYTVGEADEESMPLRAKLQKEYSPLQAFCIMLFLLISMPCIATFAIVKRETNSWKWPFVQAFGLTALAYIVTLIVYQVGRFLV